MPKNSTPTSAASSMFDPKMWDPKVLQAAGLDPKALASMDPKMLASMGLDPKAMAALAGIIL